MEAFLNFFFASIHLMMFPFLVVVIPKTKSKDYRLDEVLKQERYEEEILLSIGRDEGNGDETVGAIDTINTENTLERADSLKDAIENESTEEPLSHALKNGKGPDSRALNKTARYRSPRKRAAYGHNSRCYDFKTIGKQQDLPCPSGEESESGHLVMSSQLFTLSRIIGGTKILSFSDSRFLEKNVQAGILRKGGDFSSTLFEMNVEGFGLYIMDDYPREVMAVVVRDIQFQKPMGSIKAAARVRHFQVDAMLENARYPIIIQPSPLGVDRREPMMEGNDSDYLVLPEHVDKRECFWMQNEEKPIPVFEVECEYVPQQNMTWCVQLPGTISYLSMLLFQKEISQLIPLSPLYLIVNRVPSLNVFLCPLKLNIDMDYILRVLGMVVNSVYKFQGHVVKNLNATSHANDELKYVTRGQLNVGMTYIEKLYIAPVQFDMELNIKSETDHDGEGDSSLSLHSIAQTTNSVFIAGLLSWVINVGANFAHVSPTFTYSQVSCQDRYCAILDLVEELAKPYLVQTIKQGYKIVFSMQVGSLLHEHVTH